MNRILPALACLSLALVAARPSVAAAPAVSLQTLAYLKADQRTTLVRAGDRVIAHQPDVDHGRQLSVLGGPDGARVMTIGLGPAGVDDRGRETFEVKAVAPLRGSEVMLYVAATGRADVGGLWRWRPGSEPAKRVIAARDISEVSGLGTLLTLAEVQMPAVGNDVWLILRAPDKAAYCRLDARRLDSTARVAWAFASILTSTPDDGDVPLAIERQDVWTGRADGTLGLFRPSTGKTWRVDSAGRATSLDPVPSVDAPLLPQDVRPTPTAPPLEVPTADGPRVMRFFPDAPRLAELPGNGTPRYPVLTLSDGKTEAVIARDAIAVRPGFPVHAMRLATWCVDAGGTVTAYDAMSGEVFRMNPTQ